MLCLSVILFDYVTFSEVKVKEVFFLFFFTQSVLFFFTEVSGHEYATK